VKKEKESEDRKDQMEFDLRMKELGMQTSGNTWTMRSN